MNQDEQRAAEELDAFLTARLSGEDVFPGDELSSQQAALAAHLLNLIDKTPPDPTFIARLGARLEHAPRQARRQARWPFVENLNVTWRPAMFKRTLFAFAGAVVLALLVLFGLPLLNSQPNLQPLPSLSALSAYAQGGSNGSQLFAATQFEFKTTLPSAPARVPVFRQGEFKALTPDEVQRLAERFGLKGKVYIQQVQSGGGSSGSGFAAPPPEPPPTPFFPPTYAVLDGSRELVVTMGSQVLYSDLASSQQPDDGVALPFEKVSALATEFLQAHNLLDFPYRVEREPDGPPNGVRFVRLLDGKPVQNAEVRVSVAPDGRITFVSFRPFSVEAAGDYPIRSAQEAWDALVAGRLGKQVQYTIRRPGTTQGGVSQSGTTPGETYAMTWIKFWKPRYRPGERADFYGSFSAYLPADGVGSPVIRLDELWLRGDLQALATQAFKPLHVWGTVSEDQSGQLFLDVAGWENAAAAQFAPMRGTIQLADGQMQLRREDGKTFVLLHAPDAVPNGLDVLVHGRETDRVEKGLPVLDWMGFQSPPQLDMAQGGGVSSSVMVTVAEAAPTAVAPSNMEGGIVTSGATPAIITPPALPTVPHSGENRVEGLVGRLNASVLESADGKTRTVRAVLAETPLQGDGWAAELEGAGMAGIEQYDALSVRVWGTWLREGNQNIIKVERYEKAYPDEKVQAWLGVPTPETIEGHSVVVLKTRDGQKLILASSLRYPDYAKQEIAGTQGHQVVQEGVVRQETLSGIPIIDDLSRSWGSDMDSWTDLRSYHMQPRPFVGRQPAPALPGKAFVEQVELAYYAVSISLNPDGRPPDPAVRLVQPLWRFAGHTADGASFEILVQAVRDEYVK